jgi:TfoX/Sxy family transcriptional regulator of competence genes
MAFDEKLASRVRAVLEGSTGISEKRMFGGLAFLKHGRMFAAVGDGELMARVGKDSHGAFLARPHVRPMDFTGRPMVGYVYVEPAGLEKDTDLSFWVKHCEGFAAGLPPKAKKQPVAAAGHAAAPGRVAPKRARRLVK